MVSNSHFTHFTYFLNRTKKKCACVYLCLCLFLIVYVPFFRSSDGKILIASSTDGYCSIIQFQKGELGKEYKSGNNTPIKFTSNKNYKSSVSNNDTKKVTENLLTTIDIDNSAMDIDMCEVESVSKKNLENMIDENIFSKNITIKKKKLSNEAEVEETEDIKLVYNEDSTSEIAKVSAKSTPKKTEAPLLISNKTPRRVKLITLSSPRGLK